jgi:hypothetical protein
MTSYLGALAIIGGIACIGAIIYYSGKKNRRRRKAALGFLCCFILLAVALNMDSSQTSNSQQSPAPESTIQQKSEATHSVTALLPFQRSTASLIDRYKSTTNKISQKTISAVTGNSELDEIHRIGTEISTKLLTVEVSDRYREDRETISLAASGISEAAENCKKYLDDRNPSRISEAQKNYAHAIKEYTTVRNSIIKKAFVDGYKIPVDLTPPEIKE